MRQTLPPDVLAALHNRDKIQAIRLLRSHTGLGLAEAKQAVEAGSFAAPHAELTTRLSPALPPAAIAALAGGNKIEAIKLAREANGIGLKEAKELVDAAEAGSNRNGSTNAASGLAPGEVSRSSSLISWILIAVAALAVGVWLLVRGL